MQKVMLVFVFAFSLFLKVTNAAGEEGQSGKTVEAPVKAQVAEGANSSKAMESADYYRPAANNNNNNNNIVVPSPIVISNNTGGMQDVASVLGTKANNSNNQAKIALIPMAGGTMYTGRWNNQIRNAYSMGLALEVAASQNIGIEVEGSYARSRITYAYYGHDFDQYTIGGNGKYYLSKGILQPYFGLGILALHYNKMSYGPSMGYSTYNQWVGAIQPLAGVDVAFSDSLAVGFRGAWVIPAFNRATDLNGSSGTFPGYEESSLINTSYFKMMGSVKVMF